MPRSRKRRRRPRRGKLNPFTLVVGLLVVVGLWVVGGDMLDSLPPGINRALPDLHAPQTTTRPVGNDGGGAGAGAGDLASNTRAIRRLGGTVDYGTIDRSTGQ